MSETRVPYSVHGNNLTIKQEKFAQLYAETGNASDAYRMVYDCRNMKPATIHSRAHDVMVNSKVNRRIEELMVESRVNRLVTRERLSDEFWSVVDCTKGETKPSYLSAKMQALIELGKLHGLYIDRKEIQQLNLTLSDVGADSLQALKEASARKSLEGEVKVLESGDESSEPSDSGLSDISGING